MKILIFILFFRFDCSEIVSRETITISNPLDRIEACEEWRRKSQLKFANSGKWEANLFEINIESGYDIIKRVEMNCGSFGPQED